MAKGLRTQQVRVLGTPKTAKIGNKFTIHNNKENKLWCPRGDAPELYPHVGRWIQCIQYDNHFIAINPEFVQGKKNAWFALCSCGALAQIMGYNAYKEGASVSTHGDVMGEMIVCSAHIETGRHGDGSS